MADGKYLCQIRQIFLPPKISSPKVYQIGGISVTDMMDKQKFPNLSKFSRATLFRHAKKSFDEDQVDLRHSNPGRPRLSSIRDTRVICRQIKILRDTTGSFSSKDLQASHLFRKKCQI